MGAPIDSSSIQGAWQLTAAVDQNGKVANGGSGSSAKTDENLVMQLQITATDLEVIDSDERGLKGSFATKYSFGNNRISATKTADLQVNDFDVISATPQKLILKDLTNLETQKIFMTFSKISDDKIVTEKSVILPQSFTAKFNLNDNSGKLHGGAIVDQANFRSMTDNKFIKCNFEQVGVNDDLELVARYETFEKDATGVISVSAGKNQYAQLVIPIASFDMQKPEEKVQGTVVGSAKAAAIFDLNDVKNKMKSSGQEGSKCTYLVERKVKLLTIHSSCSGAGDSSTGTADVSMQFTCQLENL